MKKALFLTVFVIIITSFVLAGQTAKKEPYDLQVSKLYATADEKSALIYKIPISVKLLDVSADANWYKVNISYTFGPLNYNFTGWTKIPVGDILVDRQQKSDKIAQTK